MNNKTEDYNIENDVPVPPYTEKSSQYPFAEMKVGDSFTSDIAKRFTLSSSATYFVKTKQPEWKFSIRTTGDLVRIWRVK